MGKPEKTLEADQSERGLDELMLLAQSRHLSEEPEVPVGLPGAPVPQAAHSGRAESAEATKSEEVRSAVHFLPTLKGGMRQQVCNASFQRCFAVLVDGP